LNGIGQEFLPEQTIVAYSIFPHGWKKIPPVVTLGRKYQGQALSRKLRKESKRIVLK
jgi:hypothetical protein